MILVSNCTAQKQFCVYFDSNKFELNNSEHKNLKNWILNNKDVKIIGISGFCDEDGTNVLNDTLSKKRIDFVYAIIKNQLKIREDFKSRSFGELHQLSKIKAENRKVILFFIDKIDFNREDEIIGIKKQIVSENKFPGIIPEKNYPEKLIIKNPDGTKSEFKLDVNFMKKVASSKKDEKLQLENLNFNFNTFAVNNESRNKLYELLIVMEQNPNLKIEIHGHICCNANSKEILSLQRAKAVYGFLIMNGIEKKRLNYKGFGSTIPIYNLPEKSEQERAANRRVEILVIENNL